MCSHRLQYQARHTKVLAPTVTFHCTRRHPRYAQPSPPLLPSLPLVSIKRQKAIPSVLAVFACQSHVANLSMFYVVFSSLVVLLFPLAVIDLLAGFLFHMSPGFPLALATKTSGSVLCFLLSRHTCR